MLIDKLAGYNATDIYPMHMPGHKRNTLLLGTQLPYELDITEIPGFDNLADPRGVLLDLSRLAGQLYGSGRAFPLTGGSTCGILAAITACVSRGGKLIMSRDCHFSVYNAAGLGELETAYILPRVDEQSGIMGSVAPEDVDAALCANPDASLVVVTSPTYEGAVSDIAAIAAVAHSHGVPLMVDSAHGAHFGFSPDFPENAVRLGADIVVMSLHKTLPAFTQCALLHVSGELVDYSAVARCVNIFGTSSPSYVLLASIDCCLRLIKRDGARLFDGYARRLRIFYDRVAELRRLRIVNSGPAFFAFDPGKIVVSAAGYGLSGPMMAELMREKYLIEIEMASADYIVAMTSVTDTDEGINRLYNAIIGMDNDEKPCGTTHTRCKLALPERACSIAEALRCKGELVELSHAEGRIALEYVRAYPPGVPLIVPGEVVDDAVIERMLMLADAGIPVSLHAANIMVK